MKKYIYILLFFLLNTSYKVYAQQDRVVVEKDTFSYKRVSVINRDKGNILLKGAKIAKENNQKSNLRNDNSGIGETPGVLSVSLAGAATYNIPIKVPPGIDGIAPDLSITYNSQAGNGLLGYGWNLSGVSVISRIPASKYHDDKIDGVDFDNLDRFALDGERLILKSGTYGTNGAIYETENFSNVKITSYGTSSLGASYGPAYFEVRYPDGSVARYGDSSDSLSYLGYAITYWENPQGIRINYEYRTTYNAQRIAKIKYGARGTDIPINEIVFNYFDAERLEQSFVNDISITQSKVMNRIESFVNGVRFKKYDFGGFNRTNLEYQRLSYIKEFSGVSDSNSHSSINFSYPNASTSPSVNYDDVTTDLNISNIEQRNAQVIPFDMTGNGKMDFILYPDNPDNSNVKNKFWTFSDIQSGSNNYPYEYNTGKFEAIFPSLLTNYQGKVLPGQGATIVQKGSGRQVKFKVYKKAPPSAGGVPLSYDYTKIWNAPSYTYDSSPESSSQRPIPFEYVSGDFDGDGLTDVLAIGKPYTSRSCYYHSNCDDPDPCEDDGLGGPVIIIDDGTGDGDCITRFQKSSGQLDETKNIDKKYNKSDARIDKNVEISKPFDLESSRTNNCGYSCYSYTSNYKSVYLINLRRDMSSNFAGYVGYLTQHLAGEYRLKTGDFNGDGKTDIVHIVDGKMTIYYLNENNQFKILWETIDDDITIEDIQLFGDYNGDGKTDFMDPEANNSNEFNVFLSTGTKFLKGTYNHFPFTYRRTTFNPNNGVLNGYNLIPADINGDGKTDIVEYNTETYNANYPPWVIPPEPTQTINIYKNLRIIKSDSDWDIARIRFDFGGTTTKIGDLQNYPIPIFLSSSQQNKNLDFASISNNKITNFSFTEDHRRDVLMNEVENNGVRYEIDYKNLDPDLYNDDYAVQIYQNEYNQTYPNIDLNIALSSKVVSTIKRYAELSSGTEETKKIFAYKGAVYNAEGLGFFGFSAVASSNWYSENSQRIFTVSKYDPGLRGAMVESYSMANFLSFTTPSSNYISKTTYQYSSSLSSNKVFNLKMDSSFSQSYLEGTFTNTTYQYDAYNNPTSILKSFMGGSSTQNITYSNDTGSNYHIGRVTNVTNSSTIEGETFNSEQQFTYSGYLLTQRKVKGNGTEFNIYTYDYDDFGNIIEIITTPFEEIPRQILYEYDYTGRFVIKTTDIEGLETTFEYNPSYGDWNLSKITNPFNQETAFQYDEWNRQIKVIDYLGNESTTDFTEVNNAYTVTKSSDDGSGMIVEYDQLGRVSVVKEKNLFGDWISKKYEYDVLGRLIKESEPYSGSPSQWNETVYDIYSRPTSQTLYTGRSINITYNNLTTTVDDGVKVVTSVRNQFGGPDSVTDPGGTINYSYYGNGGLKTANYNGVLVATEQDGWGRKTKLTDPSAGVYEYEYNEYGETTKEITPKGTTEYTYSPTGQLTEKSITGDRTDMTISYNYNPVHKFLDAITLVSADGNNSSYNYNYDTDIRLTSMSETTPYAEFSQQYTYDTFGRVETEQYNAKLLSNNKTSNKKIKNIYQNGALKTIQDHVSGNNIWNATAVNERGQLTSASVGNNMTDSRSYDTFGYLTSTDISRSATSSPEVLMQLTTDFNAQRGTLNSRSNSLFSWSETFEYDNLDRLLSFDDNDGDNNLTYDDLGRITFNNEIGDYSYSGTSYQVDDIDLNTQGDLYYQNNKLQQVAYNAFKKPHEVSEQGKEKIGFQYNAFMGRSNMFYGDVEEDIYLRNNRKHYSYDGSMEISFDEEDNLTTFVTYIGGDAYSAPAMFKSQSTDFGGIADYFYLHRDYLGSILLITDSNGNAKEKRHFDAWGKTVKVTDGNDNTLEKLTFLDRGYTGHEHLQGVGLIHMNGRLYDPNLKRFLSPDNYIQDVGNTQNFNRYSYVMNNPLMYTDPTGEMYDPHGSEQGVFSNEAQVGLGALLASAASVINWKGIRMRDVSDWTTKHIFRSIQDVGDWIGGWFKKRSYDPVEEVNYEGLSSDPLSASSMPISNELFNGGGSESNLGITAGDVADTVTDFIPIVGSGKDIYQGIRDGNWWQAAAGFGGLLLDIGTLGTASLVKGAIKTTVKQGIKAYTKKSAKKGVKLLSQGMTPNAGGKIISKATEQTETFYRVFSKDPNGGSFLTKTKPRSRAYAREALALPKGNSAKFIQEVTVPKGVILQRSRVLPAFGKRGGAEQFQILNFEPNIIFGPGKKFR